MVELSTSRTLACKVALQLTLKTCLERVLSCNDRSSGCCVTGQGEAGGPVKVEKSSIFLLHFLVDGPILADSFLQPEQRVVLVVAQHVAPLGNLSLRFAQRERSNPLLNLPFAQSVQRLLLALQQSLDMQEHEAGEDLQVEIKESRD
jgi:hypothetical protein